MVRYTTRPGGPSVASLLLLSCLLGADRANLTSAATTPSPHPPLPPLKICVCFFGVEARGDDCPENLKHKCTSCDEGYVLIGDVCHEEIKLRPTQKPTPTPEPTPKPIQTPTPPPTPPPSGPDPGGHDDPHLTTLKGERYDYHGQCDLIYTTCPSFDGNKGLRIHMRTKHVEPKNWSTITNLAVKIGKDTFELQSDGTYRINSEVNPALSDTTNLAGHNMKRVGFKSNGNTFSIALDDGLSLDLTHFPKTLKTNEIRKILAFKISGVHEHRDTGGTSLLDCVGLSSTWDHPEGDRFLVGRSGTTYPRTDTSFGNEWQVDLTKDDPMLFAEDFGQQLPDGSCVDGLKDAGRRQLEGTPEGDAVIRQAEDACRHLTGGDTHTFEACVHDVIVTGDVSFAEDPWYNGEF